MAVPTCNPSTLEVEAGGSRVQGQDHSQLRSKSEDILSQRKTREKGEGITVYIHVHRFGLHLTCS